MRWQTRALKITTANFRDCENLTDATKEAVTAQRPDFNFEFWQLEVQQRLHVKNTACLKLL